MDGDMSGAIQKPKRKSGHAAALGLFLALSLVPQGSALAAEILPDPTRPAAEAGLAGDVAIAPSGPVLQSVMIRPNRRTAVISGQLLAEGERFGDAKLVKVSEGEVILVGPEGRQTLKLFPGVEKHFVRPAQEEKPKRGKPKSKRNPEQKAS
jgi:MSHA biogenesis protein MshK